MEPKFNHKIGICFATDDNYFNYLIVALQSLLDHSSENNEYDILILTNFKNEYKQKLLLSIFQNNTNFSIRFVDISNYMNFIENFHTVGHITIAMYYRIFIEKVCAKYKQVIYIDVDTIILKDIANLYQQCKCMRGGGF